MDDDLSLLAAYARSRDAASFARLVERHAGMVYGVCLRACGDRQRAEDAAQECFLALARAAGQIRGSVGGWLHAVAVRIAGRLRAQRAWVPLEAVGDVPAAAMDGWRALLPRVDAAIAELPDALREPIVLHFLHGLGQQQVAGRLRLSQPTVHRRLRDGLAALRRRLAVEDEGQLSAGMAALAIAAPGGLLGDLQRMALVGPAPTAAAVGAGAAVGWWTSLACAAAIAAGTAAAIATPSPPAPAAVADAGMPPAADPPRATAPATAAMLRQPPVILALGMRNGPYWDPVGVPSPDDRHLACSNSLDGQIRIFDLASGDAVFAIDGSKHAAIAWSADGALLAVLLRDQGRIDVWDWRQRVRIEAHAVPLAAHPMDTGAFGFADGDRLLVADGFGQAVVVERRGGTVRRLDLHPRPALIMARLTDGSVATGGSAIGFSTNSLAVQARGNGSPLIAVGNVDADADSRYSQLRPIRVFDVRDGALVGELPADLPEPGNGRGRLHQRLLAGHDGNTLLEYLRISDVPGSPDRSRLSIWDLRSRTLLGRRMFDAGWINVLGVLADGRVLLRQGRDPGASLWKPGADRAADLVPLSIDGRSLLRMNAAGTRWIAVDPKRGITGIVDLSGAAGPAMEADRAPAPPAVFPRIDPIRDDHLAISRDGTRLAVGDGSHRVGVWDLSALRFCGVATVGRQHPRDSTWLRLAFSKDGRALACARGIGGDRETRWHIERWDLDAGTRSLPCGDEEIRQSEGYPQHSALTERWFALAAADRTELRDWTAADPAPALDIPVGGVLTATADRIAIGDAVPVADGRFKISGKAIIFLPDGGGAGVVGPEIAAGQLEADPAEAALLWRSNGSMRVFLRESGGRVQRCGPDLDDPGGLSWGSYGRTQRDARLFPGGRLLAVARGHGTDVIDTATGALVVRLLAVDAATWVAIGADGAAAGSPAGLALCRRLEDGRAGPLRSDPAADAALLRARLQSFGMPATADGTIRIPAGRPIGDDGRKRPKPVPPAEPAPAAQPAEPARPPARTPHVPKGADDF